MCLEIFCYFDKSHLKPHLHSFKIKDEAFLEDISSLLNIGGVPNLFSSEEKQEICDRMIVLDRRREKSKRTDGSPQALFNYFIEHCRDLLHIILAMSPFGSTFRNRLRKFPSLINCCSIDWFHVTITTSSSPIQNRLSYLFKDWPEEALVSVSRHFINQIDEFDENKVDSCIEICRYFHATSSELSIRMANDLGRYYYVTPSTFLDLLNLYKKLFTQKRKQVTAKK